jgi:hypothetical protein
MAPLRLAIEPIPARSRRASLAQLLPRPLWDRLRRSVYRRAGHRCRACGRAGQLHCHEIWGYHDPTGCQSLRGVRALCQDCHRATHILFTHDSDERQRLLEHYTRVNGLSWEQAVQHVRDAYRRQRWLDHRRWAVVLGPRGQVAALTRSGGQHPVCNCIARS